MIAHKTALIYRADWEVREAWTCVYQAYLFIMVILYDDDEFLVARRQLCYGRMKRGIQAATEKIDVMRQCLKAQE